MRCSSEQDQWQHISGAARLSVHQRAPTPATLLTIPSFALLTIPIILISETYHPHSRPLLASACHSFLIDTLGGGGSHRAATSAATVSSASPSSRPDLALATTGCIGAQLHTTAPNVPPFLPRTWRPLFAPSASETVFPPFETPADRGSI